MKVQMQVIDELIRLRCPKCGTMKDLNRKEGQPIALSDMECPVCREQEKLLRDKLELEELYSPGEKPPPKNRPFQNCFEDCPLTGQGVNWNKVQNLAARAMGAIEAIYDEIEEDR